jgi:conserved repeat domain
MMDGVIGTADWRDPVRGARVVDITQLQESRLPPHRPLQVTGRMLCWLAMGLLLLLAPRELWAQAANQCSLANTSPIITSPANTGWLNDNSTGITHTPTLNGNQTSTRYGIQTNGAIVIAGELQWNNPAGLNSGRATMEILVNGVRYATLFTSEANDGPFSTTGSFWPDNGSLISVDGNAETATQQAFAGDATSVSPRTYRPFTVRLPTTVTQVTSVQYVYRSNYSDDTTDDDIRFRNIQINQCKATLRLQKQIVTGRESGTDQFALSISSGGSPLASTTTTGTGTTVNTGLATVVPFNPGVLHTLSEAAAGTTDLGDYTSTYSCANASSGTGTVLPSGTGTSFSLTPASGDDITCTVVNTRRPVTLTLTKISQGGTRAFTFTGNNGWTSQTITTTTPGVGVTGATQTLTNPLVATTINETLPSGFLLNNVTCTGMGAGGTVTQNTGSFTLNAAAVDAGSNIACTVTNAIQSQPAFPGCSSEMYLAQSPNVNTDTTLYGVSAATNPMTFPAIGTGIHTYNAIGFNPVDNYIYGINQGGGSGNNLIRIGADGSSLLLGPVAGLGLDNWINGTMSPDGTLYVLGGGGSSNLRAINVQTNTSTLITLSTGVNSSDFAWIGGLIYTVESNGQLRSINPATGQVTSIGTPQGAIVMGAMFGSPTGLFGSDNNGGFYRIDLATGVRTLISGSPSAGQNDGANCPTAPITFDADLSVTKTNTPASGPNDLTGDGYMPGQARTYSVVVTNSGPFGAQNITVSDPIPAGIDGATMSWTCASTSGGAVCGAPSGTGALNDTGLDLPAGAVATYLVTMTVPAGFTGNLTNTVTITPPLMVNDSNATNNTATDVDQSVPRLVIRKISIGGVDSFGFSGTNGVQTQTLTTTTAGTPISGAVQMLIAASTATTITESTSPATYQVTDIACTGLGAGGTATPDLANRTVVLDAAATAVGASIECTFTNTLRQADIQVVKTASPDPVVAGEVVTYQIVVTNNGPLAADGAVLTDVAGAGQDCTTPSTTAICTATGGASCPSPTVPVSNLLGSGITLPVLPAGGQVTVTLQCTVTASGL